MRRSYEASVLPLRSELLSAAKRMTRSASDAEDLVQETMLRAWTFWDRFEPGTNARAWTHRILVHTFINGYRRRTREKKLLEALHADPIAFLEPPRSETSSAGTGVSDRVRSAIDDLPAPFRAVLVHVDVQEASYEEAARAIGCPVGTVMSRLHRARRIMKRALCDHAEAHGITRAPKAA